MNRVSTYPQAGRDKVDLHAKTDAVTMDYWRMAPPTKPWSLFSPPELPEIFSGIEEGKLSKPRPILEAAVRYCRQQDRPMILIASDLSRFIRSERYHRQNNPDVWPTDAEFQRFRELTQGVILATIHNPMASEAQRHSYATRRTGKAGRRPKIESALALEILELRGSDEGFSLAKIAMYVSKRRGIQVSKSGIQRLLNLPVPDHDGLRLGECEYAYRVCRDAWVSRGRPTDFRRVVSKRT